MILVTGATGMVGSYLTYALVSRGRRVRAIKRSNSSIALLQNVFSYLSEDPDLLYPLIEWVDGDVLDMYSLEEAMEGVSEVYHCAGVVSFEPRNRKQMMLVNVEGTANVVNAAIHCQVKKLCHVSSIASLSRTEESEVIDENASWKTSKRNSVYALSKCGGEREVWRGIEEGLDAVIVNPAVIIGYAGNNGGSSQFFSTIDKCSWFYSNGVNGFVDVQDVVKCMIALMESNITGQRYVLSAEDLSYKDIFTMIAENLGKRKPFMRAGNHLLELVWRAEKVRSTLFGGSPMITKETVNTQKSQYYYSSKKIKEALAFEFTPIKESIAFYSKFYLSKNNDSIK